MLLKNKPEKIIFTAEQRYELREKQAPPILSEFKQWLEDHLTKVPPQQKLGQAIQYSLRQLERTQSLFKRWTN